VKKGFLARWRKNFLAGMAILLPALISIGALLWIFGTLTNFTDALLFFLPRSLTHSQDGAGPVYWHWSIVAFGIAIGLVCAVGLLTRNYVGKRLIAWVDALLMQVPVLNKIYSATKQVNDALSTGNKNSFKTVVLVEFPRAGIYSLGFITNEDPAELSARAGEKVVCVFVPTTPNPTTGFLVIVPEAQARKLNLSVPEAIKYIISLGSIAPEFLNVNTLPVPADPDPRPVIAGAK
jgi:uncharacterized membrane protein